jgi:hypothetical protein
VIQHLSPNPPADDVLFVRDLVNKRTTTSKPPKSTKQRGDVRFIYYLWGLSEAAVGVTDAIG